MFRACTNGTELTIHVVGDWSCRNTARFRELFKEQTRDFDAVILDLTETTSVDSSALGAILALREDLPAIEIRIVGPSESVRKRLAAASFDRLFRIL